MTKAVRTLSAVRGGRVCAHSCVVPCGERVLAPWCACVQDGAPPAAVPLRGRAWNSVSHSVFVHCLFQSRKPCKELGLHSFAPAVCCAALSVLVYRLCPAEVTHCLCRGTLGELEVTLMLPLPVFVTRGVHKCYARESRPGDPCCSMVRTTAEYLRAAVDFF